MTRILLTGASGFLGSALAHHWAGAQHEVHVLVRPTSRLARLDAVRASLGIHVAADTRSAARIVAASRPEVIVHAACAYGRAGESAWQVFDANVMLGMALLQAVLDGGQRTTFINTGSALDPEVSAYALSKRQFSDWGAQLAASSPERLRFVDLRLQHMYGPGDDRSKFTTHVLHACHAGEPELRMTAGEQERDLIHLDDVVSAYDAVLDQVETLPPHETIDVGSGTAPRIRDFVALVHRLTGASTHLDFGALPYRPREAMRCVADTARLRSLGWRPIHDLTSGVLDTLRKEFPT